MNKIKKLFLHILGCACAIATLVGVSACGLPAHGHIWDEGEITTEVSCAVDGVKTFRCECGETYEEITPAYGHKFEKYEVVSLATCTKNTVQESVCENGCGEKKQVEIENTAYGHKFVSYTPNNDAACEKDATKTATCENGCGEKDTVAIEGTALAHVYTNYVSNGDAKCGVDGTKTAACDRGCGGKDTVADVGTALEHVYTNYVSNGDAKCGVDGTKTAACDRGCGEKDTVAEEGTALEHVYTNYVSDNNATCEADGTKTAKCDHGCGTPKTVTDEGSGGHRWNSNVCLGCGIAYFSEGLEYTANAANDGYYVSGLGDCTDSEIYIPSTYGNMPVVGIANEAFKGKSSITKVSMPESVVKIGDGAFSLCVNIEIIVFSPNLEKLGAEAFKGCAKLDNVVIPDTVTKIENGTFDGCSALKNVMLGQNVTALGEGAFRLCINITVIVFPSNLENIGAEAFKGCEKLDNVVVPDKVTQIGNSAFEGCSNLANVTLGQSVTNIGSKAFYLCIKITIIIMPNGVTYVGENAFGGCEALKYFLTELLEEIFETLAWHTDWLGDATPDTYLGDDWTAAKPEDNAKEGVLIYGEWYQTIAPLCKKDGEARRDCVNVVGRYETKVLPQLDHDIKTQAAKDAACGVDGWYAYEYCSRCDYTTKQTIPALAHSFVTYISDNNAECEKDGTKTAVCENGCGTPKTVTDEGSALGHDRIPHAAQAETCTAEGWNEYETCSRCDYTTKQTIPEKGHKYTNYVSNGDAECEKDGTKTAICENGCGSKDTVVDEGSKLGHDKQTVAEKKPTCIASGWNAYEICSRCDYTTKVELPASGHTFVDGTCSICLSKVSQGLCFSVSNGVATLTGIGTCGDTDIIVPDYYEGAPVQYVGDSAFKKNSKIKSIQFPNTLKTIWGYAFGYCSALESVYFGKGLEMIEGSAFNGCVMLESIELPDSLYSIGYRAFANSALTSVVIPDSVTELGTESFSGCWALESVTFGNALETIGEKAFYNCAALKEVTFGNALKTIGAYAFSNCTSLQEIEIHDSVTRLEQYAFSGCKALIRVTVGSSVEYCYYPFYSCESLLEIYDKSRIGQYNLSDRSDASLDNYYTPTNGKRKVFIEGEYVVSVDGEEKTLLKYLGNGTELVIPEGVTAIREQTFYKNTSLTSVVLPNSLKTIGAAAFNSCSALESVTFGNSLETIERTAFRYCTALKSIVLPDSVKAIINGAFDGCRALESVTLGNSLVTLDRYAFGDCEKLNNVVLPETLQTIGEYAFYNCKSLTKIIIPDSVTSIGRNAFSCCNALESAKLSNGLTKLEDYTFNNCRALKSVELPDSLTSIGTSVFEYDKALTHIVIPDSVTTIGAAAFYACDRLMYVELGASVKTIGVNAFTACNHLVEVKNKSSLSLKTGTTNYSGIAYYALNILSANQESCLREENGYVLYDNGTTYFVGYLGTETNLVLPDGVNKVNQYVLMDQAFVSIVLPETVTAIGTYAFYCARFASITFSVYLKQVETYAFEYATLTDVYYVGGTESKWTSISIAANNNPLKNAERHYVNGDLAYALNEDGRSYTVTGIGLYTDKNLVIPETYKGLPVTEIGKNAFKGSKQFTSVEIPNSITTIGETAFDNCTLLTSVKIPASMKEIKRIAFHGCTALKDVYINDIAAWCDITFEIDGMITSAETVNPFYYATNLYVNGELVTELVIPDTVTVIKPYAFYDCESLVSIKIPTSLTAIGKEAFRKCDNLTNLYITDLNAWMNVSIEMGGHPFTAVSTGTVSDRAGNLYLNGELVTELVIPDTVTAMKGYTFWGCTSITNITFGSGVTSIGERTFLSCNGLTELVIPANVAFINDLAFSGCFGLTSLKLSYGLIGIGYGAFSACINLTELVIPDSVESIEDNAFYNGKALTSVTIGSGVTYLDGGAFEGCDKLRGLTFKDTTTWYRTTSPDHARNKQYGERTDVTTYYFSYFVLNCWYKI